MTDTSASGPKVPLGIGKIISDSFSIIGANFLKVFLIGFLGALIGFLINAIFLGFDTAAGIADPLETNVELDGLWVGFVVSTLIGMVIYGLVTAMLTHLAYDSKLDRTNTIGTYVKSALPAIIPILVLGFAVGILTSLGAILLLIGALWVYAVFSVTTPVIVIEKAGFSSMGRSAALTKEYRWPIVVVLIVMFIITILLQVGGGFLASAIGGGNGFLAGIVMSLVVGLAYAVTGIVLALIYARLREVKEGVDVDQIAAVFE